MLDERRINLAQSYSDMISKLLGAADDVPPFVPPFVPTTGKKEESIERVKAPRKASQFNKFVGECMKDVKGNGNARKIFSAATQMYKKVKAKDLKYDDAVSEMKKQIANGEFQMPSSSETLA